jgi:recombination protein RecA
MSSFAKFKERLDKASIKAGIPTKNGPPEFFIDTGNYVLNKIISGSYLKGWAQGRLGAIGGPSGSGKSFLIANAIKAAQEQGCAIFLLDSENALDTAYLEAVGVDTEADNFMYRSVVTIEQAVAELSRFTKEYRADGMTDRVFIALDSLDMLMTNSQVETYAKGETKGDQGQEVKQLKSMLKTWVQDIKTLPFIIVCAKQVYQEQDRIAKLVEPYVFTDGIRFAFSQIFMITKLMLKTEDVDGIKKKEKQAEKYAGITMKARGFKTRLTKPFQQAKIQVPWDSGMDRFSGLLEVAEAVGIVVKNGSWYYLGEEKFQKGTFANYREEVLKLLIEREGDLAKDDFIEVEIEEEEAPPEGLSIDDRIAEKLKKLATKV